VLLVASIVCILIAYVYIFLMQVTIGWLVWFALFFTFGLLTGAGFYSFFYASKNYDAEDPTRDYCKYAAYVVWGIACVLLMSLCCCYNSIALGIAVFKTTCEYTK